MLKFFTDVFKLAGALLCVTAVSHPGIAQTSDPQLERILLPIFTQATPGANGSEFRVEFRAANGGNGGEARLYGDLAWLDCSPYEGLPCDDLGYISLGPGQELAPAQFRFTGAPGAYVMASSEDVRVIYYWFRPDAVIYLLLAYSKTERDDLTPEQKRILRKLIAEFK